MDERPMTGMLDEDAIRAGAVRVDTMFNLDGTTTIEWTDINGNTIRRERGPILHGTIAVDTPFEPTLEYGVTTSQMDDIDAREWDRENDAHHAVYRRAYDDAYYGNPYVRRYAETVREEDSQRLERIFCFGGWDTSDDEDEPEIKEERGGALDEFLDEFKPQTTPERSDEQK